MNHPYIFLLSFAISFSSVLYILSSHQKIESAPVVLAQATIMPTTNPTPEPSVIPSVAEESLADASQSKPRSFDFAQDDKVIPILTPTPNPTVTPTITPIPVPTATPDVWSPTEMEPVFSRFAGEYGVDKNILERLANCESHFNVNAKNGDYLGMFQFSTNTWITNRSKIGADTNPALRTNIEESIRTAAYLVSVRGTSPWPACSR